MIGVDAAENELLAKKGSGWDCQGGNLPPRLACADGNDFRRAAGGFIHGCRASSAVLQFAAHGLGVAPPPTDHTYHQEIETPLHLEDIFPSSTRQYLYSSFSPLIRNWSRSFRRLSSVSMDARFRYNARALFRALEVRKRKLDGTLGFLFVRSLCTANMGRLLDFIC